MNVNGTKTNTVNKTVPEVPGIGRKYSIVVLRYQIKANQTRKEQKSEAKYKCAIDTPM